MSRTGQTPIAVFASGRGTNFTAIAQAVRDGTLDATIVALVTDRPEAEVIARAKEFGVPAFVIPPPASSSGLAGDARRRAHEQEILKALEACSPRFLVMAGYMRIVTPLLVEAFRSERGYSRIVNVHPSLLPAFPGVDSYAQAFRHGAKVAGVTVHLVEHDVDSGPICAQEAFAIESCRDALDVEKLGLAIEHRLYPATLQWVLSEKFEVFSSPERSGDGRLCVRKN